MLFKKIFFFSITIALITFIIGNSARTQESPADVDNSQIIDSIDIQENLLDSNEAYRKQFDSLSKDGEWLKTKKTDLIRDLDNISEEDLDFDYEDEEDVVYVWRPYGTNSYWNPYYNGSWIFTSYGWMWNSLYSWGWGPYNYGRWYFSSFYGWIWFPGNVWAPNWVTWRNYNNYVGWYPTCPRVYWRGSRNQICSNRLYTSVPRNWVFVDKKDFTKKIDNTTIVSAGSNADLIKRSEKVRTAVYTNTSGPKIKYNGPDVNDISKESGEKIIPVKVLVTKSENNQYEYVKEDKGNSTKEDPNIQKRENNNTPKSNVTKTDKPTTKSPVTKTRENNPVTKSPVTKTKDNNTKKNSGDKQTQRGKPKTPTKKIKSSKLTDEGNQVNQPVKNSGTGNSKNQTQALFQQEEIKKADDKVKTGSEEIMENSKK